MFYNKNKRIECCTQSALFWGMPLPASVRDFVELNSIFDEKEGLLAFFHFHIILNIQDVFNIHFCDFSDVLN
jgi:hypothetical protein